jgi:predicted dehydrogenase
MALTVPDCDEMIRAAEAAGVKFMVGQVLRLIASYAKAKQLIESEELGKPMAISMTRLGEAFTEAFNKGWRTNRELSGGLLLEVHVHEIDFMRHVCGEVESVTAQATKVFDQEMAYEDLWHVQFQFRNGAIGLLRAGLSTLLAEHYFTIQCDGGTITTNTRKGGLTFRKPGSEPTVIEDDELNKMEDGFRWELRSWVEAILDGKPMIVTAQDGRAAVAIAEAAVESARTGRAVPVRA